MSYVYLWEFRVAPEHQEEFARRYGSDGDWAQLFRRASGYVGTELLRDRADRGRFVTIDRWRDEASYRQFRLEFADGYAALDRDCDQLTISETLIGEFST